MTSERRNYIYLDIADPMDYPEEIMGEAVARVKARFAGDLTEEQVGVAAQGITFWLRFGGNPEEAWEWFREPLTGRVDSMQDLLDRFYSPDRVSGGAEIRELVNEIGPEVVDEYNKYLEAQKALDGRPSGKSVPGDPHFKSRNTGTSGLGGQLSPEDPRINNDNQSLHYGPGYDS